MKESEALKIIDNLIVVTQKARSNMNEVIDDDTIMRELVDEMFPYTQGDDTILPLLIKISEAERLAPLDFYNILTLIDMKGSEVAGMYALSFGRLPERDINLLINDWDTE